MLTAHEAREVAFRIATRLCASAQWSGDACTWPLFIFDRSAPPGAARVSQEMAGSSLYNGSAGIALFLTEAYREFGEQSFARTARGALRHSLAGAPMTGGAVISFHSGLVGIAYALDRFDAACGSDEHDAAIQTLLTTVSGREHLDTGLDVIAGGGGALPALLSLAASRGEGLPAEIAGRVGEHLIRVAARSSFGWSWGSGTRGARNLLGYAHGTAGIAHGLAELYAATGDGRFRYAAEQGVAYERHYFDSAEGNWPDFRHVPLTEYLMRSGSLAPAGRAALLASYSYYRPQFMSAWCHGATGIGLARVRMFELLADSSYADEARVAARTVARNIGARWRAMGFGMCHGITTDCQLLLQVSKVPGEEEFATLAHEILHEASVEFEGKNTPWRSGAIEGRPDPTLMLGEAGVGFLYLRVANPEMCLPSLVTIPRESVIAGPRDAEASAVMALHDDYLKGFFGLTHHALLLAQPDLSDTIQKQPNPAAIFELFRAAIAREEREDVRLRLLDVMAIDTARLELERTEPYGCDTLLDDLRRALVTPVAIERSRLALSATARLLTPRFDWRPFESGTLALKEVKEADDLTLLVQYRDQRAKIQVLEAFAAAVLGAISRGVHTVEALMAELIIAMDHPADADVTILRTHLIRQLAEFQRCGVIVATELASVAPVTVLSTESAAH